MIGILLVFVGIFGIYFTMSSFIKVAEDWTLKNLFSSVICGTVTFSSLVFGISSTKEKWSGFSEVEYFVLFFLAASCLILFATHKEFFEREMEK